MYIQSKLWNPESRARKHVVVDSEQLMSGGNWLRESFESVVLYFSTCESTYFLLMLVFCTNSHSEKSRRISALLRSQLTFLFDASLNPQLFPLEFYARPANRRHFGGNVWQNTAPAASLFFSSFFFSCLMKHVWPSLTRIDSAWHLDATWDSKHMLQSTLLRTAVRTHTRTWTDEDFICAASHERKPSSRASSALFRATRSNVEIQKMFFFNCFKQQ